MRRFWFADTIMKNFTLIVILYTLSTNSPTFNTATIFFIPLIWIVGIIGIIWVMEPIYSLIIDTRKRIKDGEKNGIYI